MSDKKCKACMQVGEPLCSGGCPPPLPKFAEWEGRLLQALDDDQDLLVSWAPQIRVYYDDRYSPAEAAVMVEDLECGAIGADYVY